MSITTYQCIVTYPLSAFPKLDEPIQNLAITFGLTIVGSGAGFGERDLEFALKALDRPTADFITQILQLPDTKVMLRAIALSAGE